MELYLSRAWLAPQHPQVRRDLRACEAMHRRVMGLFPVVGGAAPRQALGVLYRVEPERETGAVTLLIQSRAAPEWRWLPDGYLAAARGGNPATRPLAPLLAAIAPGRRFGFRLHATPLKAERRPGGRGHREFLRQPAEQVAWLTRQLDRGGCDLIDARVLRVSAASITLASGNREFFGGALFEGLLSVRHAEQARELLVAGIGRGRPYGCGLLSLAPVAVD
jgi:CRISPR system Cascade subunit CasE